jgi:hypothetical protein
LSIEILKPHVNWVVFSSCMSFISRQLHNWTTHLIFDCQKLSPSNKLMIVAVRYIIEWTAVIGNLSRFWLSRLGRLGFFLPNTFNLFRFLIVDFERTWWRLLQKRVVGTEFDKYIFIVYSLVSISWLIVPSDDYMECNSPTGIISIGMIAIIQPTPIAQEG